MLELSSQFEHFCLLESNNYDVYPYSNFGFFVAIDSLHHIKGEIGKDFFDQLGAFHQSHQDWLFGYLSYELKNQTESQLSSKNLDGVECPIGHFFIPKYLFRFYEGELELGVTKEVFRNEIKELLQFTDNNHPDLSKAKITPPLKIGDDSVSKSRIRERINESAYIKSVESLKQHIQRGDIYETNFCQEFYQENQSIDTIKVFRKLNDLARAPFTAYLKQDDLYLLCSSPERYLKKVGHKIISQPIKGTIRRGETESADILLKEALLWDPKERSENVMIVDLVRNDLSKIARKRSVIVEELFGVYTFEQVHQMISTVVCSVPKNLSFHEILRATFPMGSMTGAPKFRAMELIEEHETVQRGLYSGAVGYITPLGNFDFNVVIRSIVHNAAKQYTSVQVGSAITIDCIPEYEYHECLLKAKAMLKALE